MLFVPPFGAIAPEHADTERRRARTVGGAGDNADREQQGPCGQRARDATTRHSRGVYRWESPRGRAGLKACTTSP